MFWRAQWPDPVLPGMDLGLPGLNPWLPGVDLGLPGMDPGLAGVDPGLAGVDPGLPGPPRILGTRPVRVIRRVLGRGGEEPGGWEQATRPGSLSSRTARKEIPQLQDCKERRLGSHWRQDCWTEERTTPRSRMPLASRGRRIATYKWLIHVVVFLTRTTI